MRSRDLVVSVHCTRTLTAIFLPQKIRRPRAITARETQKSNPKVTPPLGVSLHTAHRATHGNGRPRPDWSSHFALVRYVGGREGWFLTLVNSAGTFLESLEFHENPSDSKKAPALLTSVKNQPSQNHENPTLRVLVQETSGNSKGDETTKNNSLLFGNQYKC